MAGASLLTLIDDIATILDDVAIISKVAAKKTAGVLGDDLALNAQQVSGIRADRELSVVWAVAVGSFKNKLILVPAALAISAVMPWAVIPLLMLGGAFLCYEGFEKLVHKWLHSQAEDAAQHADHLRALADPNTDLVAFEKDKIRGAIRTDFILSAEIIVITLGTAAAATFWTQVTVLSVIAVLMTVGVYGLVAAIVKLDDGGLYLSQRQGDTPLAAMQRRFGKGILRVAPYLMKALSVIGTLAMFMVGGSIIVHDIALVSGWIHDLAHGVGQLPAIGALLEALTPTLLHLLSGIIVGAAVLLCVAASQKLFNAVRHS